MEEENKEEVTETSKKEEKESSKAEEKKSAAKSDDGKFEDLLAKIEKMTVLELSLFVKALEERLGVSAQAMMPIAAAAGGQAAAGQSEPSEEKTAFTLILESAGDQKIQAIKAVREINQNLGLKEAKDLVEAAPKEIRKDMPKAEAEEALKKLEAAGAKGSLK